MNPSILNREFKHPTDGWYQIEPAGEHPNQASRVMQVVDAEAIENIVNRFNTDADASKLSHGAEMLVDHEHFKHEEDKESLAYGWLNRLQARADGIYGRIRWTATGQPAVDGGDYRFFSTEYDPADLKILNTSGETRRIRPMRLDGLTLTNSPNNKGGRPITNRREQFRQGADAPADKQTETKGKLMKSVATRLGLSADASEEAVLAEVTKLQNRATTAEAELTPLKNRATELEANNQTLLAEQVDGMMDAHGIKAEDKVRNRLRPVLLGLKNREDRTATLADFGFTPGLAKNPAAGATGQTRLHNRDTKPPGTVAEPDAKGDEAKATKIMNRALEIQKQVGNTLPTAIRQAQNEAANAS